MRDALNATGRSIFYSICEWGVDGPTLWTGKVGNSWHTTNDINDTWARSSSWPFHQSSLSHFMLTPYFSTLLELLSRKIVQLVRKYWKIFQLYYFACIDLRFKFFFMGFRIKTVFLCIDIKFLQNYLLVMPNLCFESSTATISFISFIFRCC